MRAEPPVSRNLSLRELGLRPGMFVQAAAGDGTGMPTEARFCAAIEGKGLMVVPLHEGEAGAEWRDGAALEIRGFTGQYDFRFPTRVLGSFSVPFAYVLLAWPSRIEARQVRSALRVATALAARVRSQKGATVDAQVLDLSHAGAMLEFEGPAGRHGDEVQIGLLLPFDGVEHPLELKGRICHSGRGVNPDKARVGVAFAGVARADRALLQAYTLSCLQQQTVVG